MCSSNQERVGRQTRGSGIVVLLLITVTDVPIQISSAMGQNNEDLRRVFVVATSDICTGIRSNPSVINRANQECRDAAASFRRLRSSLIKKCKGATGVAQCSPSLTRDVSVCHIEVKSGFFCKSRGLVPLEYCARKAKEEWLRLIKDRGNGRGGPGGSGGRTALTGISAPPSPLRGSFREMEISQPQPGFNWGTREYGKARIRLSPSSSPTRKAGPNSGQTSRAPTVTQMGGSFGAVAEEEEEDEPQLIQRHRRGHDQTGKSPATTTNRKKKGRVTFKN